MEHVLRGAKLMFNPLGALGSFGTGAMQGFGTGMDLMDKYRTLKGQSDFIQSMGGMEGLSQMLMPASQPPMPSEPSQAAQQPTQPPAQPPGPPPAQPGATGSMFGGMRGWAPGERPMAMGAAPQATAQAAPQQPMPQRVPPMQQPQPQQPPIQPTAERGEAPKLTPRQQMDFMQYGIGPFSMPQMVKRIEKSMPNASLIEKFYALKAGMKLMNGSGQQQFSQMMQVAQFQQRQQQHEDTLAQQQRMEGHRIEAENLREDRYLRGSQYMQQQQGAAQAAQKNLVNNELRTEKVKGHIDALSELVKQVQITGNITVDTFLRNAQSKLGWPQDKYFQYQKQLGDLQAEIGAMNQQTLGALTVSAREDAKQLANGILTPTMLKSLGEAVRIDSKITKQASQKIIDKHNRNMEYYMQSRGQLPPAEPDEEETSASTAAAAPTTSDEGWGKSRVKVK